MEFISSRQFVGVEVKKSMTVDKPENKSQLVKKFANLSYF